jgi:hypothetical protein
MTTKDAIKLLPMDEKVKVQLLNMFDYMEPEQKRTVERLAWKTYDYMYSEKIQENMQQQFNEVEEGKAHFGKDFFQEVSKKTKREMGKQTDESTSAVDIAAARRAMEQIMNEIRASKKHHKAS